MEPVRFARSRGGKALGCVVYAIAGPAAAIALGAFLGLFVSIGIQELGGSEDASRIGFVAAAVLVFFPVLWFMWRNFRQRAYFEVAVHDDRIEIAVGEKPDAIPFATLQGIRLTTEGEDLACTLIQEKGKRWKLPSDIAPFSKVREVLEERLVPVLLRRMETESASGRVLRFQENVFRAYLRILWGVLMFPLGLALIVSIKHAFKGVAMLKSAPVVIRQGWRGRHGGLEVRSGGVASCAGLARKTIPWSDLTVKELDEAGLVLESRGGSTLPLTPFAENFWPGARWLANRVSQRPAS